MPEPRPMDVAVAIIEQEGQYLIAQRLPNDSFGGRWEFPGGKCRPGESLEACLAREIREELELEISVGEKLMEIEHPYPRRTIRLHCFACRVSSGQPRAVECSAWRWVTAGELDRYTFPPATGPIIKAIKSGKSLAAGDSDEVVIANDQRE